MKKFLILILLLFQSIFVFSQADSSDLTISILTCASGEEIYASFGHCAFRVVSKSKNIDRVYNYGTFNYKQPFFVLKFVRGFLDYAVSAYGYNRFRQEYIREKRKVVEQQLNLTVYESQVIYDFLEWNALEENRYYKYNFLEDNCATRIRDVIINSCGENVKFPQVEYDFTLRDAIDERIEEMPWFRFGITMLMGLPVDKKANTMSAMFLPDFVYFIFNDTKIVSNGVEYPIVKNSSVVVDFDEPVSRTDILTYISPALILWILAAFWLWVTYKEIKENSYYAWADKILFSVVGFLGLVFVVMWFFTEHTVTVWNLNVFWAWSLHLVAAWNVKKNTQFWKKYFKVAAIVTGFMLIAAPIIPQHYDVAFYPLLIILTMRLIRIGWSDKLKL